jgi:pilus assembly protein CpaB
VSFAADRKQGLVLELAKGRGCQMSLLLRHPDERNTENDRNFNIDEVISLLQDDKNPAGIHGAGDGTKGDDVVQTKKSDDPAPKTEPKVDPAPAPAPKPETVKVPYALVDIKGGTELTGDLIADETVFGTRELPKDIAGDAVTDLSTVTGKVLRSGLGKGQWVTPGLVGDALPKPGPRDDFTPEKAGPKAQTPTQPIPAVKAPALATRDVTIHTGTGSKTFRYEEWAPGRWRMVGQVRGANAPAAAAADDDETAPPAAPRAPAPTPAPEAERKVD